MTMSVFLDGCVCDIWNDLPIVWDYGLRQYGYGICDNVMDILIYGNVIVACEQVEH